MNKWKELFQDNRKWKERIFVIAFVQFLFAFMVLFFQPIEMYVSNRKDLIFGITDLWPVLLFVSGAFFLISTVLLSFLPGKIFDLITAIVFGINLCIYVQGNFLNGKIGTLNGDTIAWQHHKRHAAIELICWLTILLIVMLILYLNKNVFQRIVKYGCMLLVAMQMVALVTLFLTTDFKNDTITGYLSKDKMFELSEDQNVIVFVLDSFDESYVEGALLEDPTVLDEFTGFTEFTNYIATYGNTYPSITYLLTGDKYYFDQSLSDYKKEAFDKGQFLKTLHKNNYDNRVFTEEISMPADSSGDMDNHIQDKTTISNVGMLKGMYNLIAYRDTPFAMKAMFWFYTSDINLWASSGGEFSPYNISDSYFYSDLLSNDITLQNEKNCFRFYHLQGAHAPYVLNDDAQYVPAGTSRNNQIVGCLHIVDTYLQKMKEKGIYKDSTIIVTADHGDIGICECPILFIKPAGLESGAIVETKAPVIDSDLQATILQEMGISKEGFGESVFQIPENEKRDRIKFGKIETLNPDYEEVPEYLIRGFARDPNNWIKTEKSWKMKYSFYKMD